MGHIWLRLLATAGHLTPKDGGFHLYSGEEVVFEVSERWSGKYGVDKVVALMKKLAN